jgi:hypothetical protein
MKKNLKIELKEDCGDDYFDALGYDIGCCLGVLAFLKLPRNTIKATLSIENKFNDGAINFYAEDKSGSGDFALYRQNNTLIKEYSYDHIEVLSILFKLKEVGKNEFSVRVLDYTIRETKTRKIKK